MEKSRDAPGKRDGADGRWAWVVCICGTFSCMVVLGFCFSFGLLFPFLLNEFGQGKAKTGQDKACTHTSRSPVDFL